MPSLSELPSDLKRKKLMKALIRLGFEIDETGGNGSHYKVIWPNNQKCVTVQYKLNKMMLYVILKEIEKYSGITWKDIKSKL